MTTRIRLRRLGAKKRPFYRVVVADQRSPREGRFIEAIGKYHPLDDPSVIHFEEDRVMHWLRVGAQPSAAVQKLLSKVGIWQRFVEERPDAGKPRGGERARKRPPRVSAKAAAAAEAAAVAAAKAEAAAAKAAEAAASEAAAAAEAPAVADEAPPVAEAVAEAIVETSAEASAKETQPDASSDAS